MSVKVFVNLVSGQQFKFHTKHNEASVYDLKLRLGKYLGVECSCLQLVTLSGQLLKDDDYLRELLDVHWRRVWIEPKFLVRSRTPDLVLSVIVTKVCKVCNNIGKKKCGRCLSARYCSYECFRRDWPSHKVSCVARRDVVTGVALP